MAGVNNETGKPLDGFEHVQQSLGVLFSTPQGSRVMREWYGNPGLGLLGKRNVTERTLLLWSTILWMLCELFEPRFSITRIAPDSIDRLGWPGFTLEGEHRPYAHLDWEQAALFVSVEGDSVRVRSAS